MIFLEKIFPKVYQSSSRSSFAYVVKSLILYHHKFTRNVKFLKQNKWKEMGRDTKKNDEDITVDHIQNTMKKF